MKPKKRKCNTKTKDLQRAESKKHMDDVLRYLKEIREKLESPKLQQVG